MADAAAADCVGNDPLRAQRAAAPSTIQLRSDKSTDSASNSHSLPLVKSSPPHSHKAIGHSHTDTSRQDVEAVPSRASTADRHGTGASTAAVLRPESPGTAGAVQEDPRREQAQPHIQQQKSKTRSAQQLRKSASTSTTASSRTNTSTEARAAVSNRASRSALTHQSVSPAASPTTSFSSWHEPETVDHHHHSRQHPYHPSDAQGTVESFPRSRSEDQGQLQIQGSAVESVSDPSSDHHHHIESSPGIIQVNPAPTPPSPLASQPRGRPQMASSILPSLFGRRRPTSSASSTPSSKFAAGSSHAPGPAAFDFNSILSSLDGDSTAQSDIDAIAEICGRSRLSLANAHANHRGPVGELVDPETGSGASTLETVREAAGAPRDEGGRLGGSRAGSATGDDRWQQSRTSETYDESDAARQAARGAISGVVAYGSSPRLEDEGRARRNLLRVRDVSNEREQRRQRR